MTPKPAPKTDPSQAASGRNPACAASYSPPSRRCSTIRGKIGLVGRKDAWSKVGKFEDVGKARKIFLTAAQRKRLLEHCGGGFRDLIEAGMLTGVRYGELRTVLVSDYDKAARVLSIRKGKTGPRTVPLSNAAAALFDRLRKAKLPGAGWAID